MISRARAAAFSAEDAREADELSMERGFLRVPGGWRPRHELRAMTRFAVADLLHTRPAVAGHDLVLCRNTAIYFAEEVRDELHERLARSLRPGGYLVVGATERIADPASIGLEPVVPFFYRRA
jgi:chemotaxis protein methyltransferase CheR